MNDLSVVLAPSGEVRISIRGVLVGCVKKFSLICEGGAPPAVIIELTKEGEEQLPPSSSVLRQRYAQLLRSHPLVQVVEPRDTLRGGD